MDQLIQWYGDDCKEQHNLEEMEIRLERHSCSTPTTFKMFLSNVNGGPISKVTFQKTKVWISNRDSVRECTHHRRQVFSSSSLIKMRLFIYFRAGVFRFCR